MVKGSDENTAAEVAAADGACRVAVGSAIREELEGVFGDSARTEFETFVDEFTRAESTGDAEFLKKLVEASGGWKKGPDTYAALRAAVVQEDLAGDIAEAGRFLAEVQTWCDMKKKIREYPLCAFGLIAGCSRRKQNRVKTR